MNKLVKLFAFAAVTMFAVACGQTTPVVDEAAVEQARQDSIAAAAPVVQDTAATTAVGDAAAGAAAAVGDAAAAGAAAVEGAAKKVEEATKPAGH